MVKVPNNKLSLGSLNESSEIEKPQDETLNQIVQICERLKGDLPDEEFRNQTREIQNLATRLHFLSNKSKELAERAIRLLDEGLPIPALQAIMREAMKIVGATRGQMLIWIPELDEFESIPLDHSGTPINWSENKVIEVLARKSFEFKSPIFNPEVNTYSELRAIEGAQIFSALSIMVIPLIIDTETAQEKIGVLYLDTPMKEWIFTETDLWFMQFLTSLSALSIRNIRLTAALRLAYTETVQALVTALEAKDPHTSGHSERVAEYSERCAKRLGLLRHQQDILYSAALLHDVGIIGIRESILNKSSELTPEELEHVKQHAEISDGIVRGMSFLTEESRILLQHHERYDGKGYPYGLEGDEIDLEGAIIQVADSWDGMICKRFYQHEIDIESALQQLKSNSGTQFNPKVVDVFVEMIEEDGILTIEDTEEDQAGE